MYKRRNGISIFNCYRVVQIENQGEIDSQIYEILSHEGGMGFIKEVDELTQDQIDEMIRSAKEEMDDDDDLEDIPY